MPAKWNGELVVYAHGIVDPELPVALPTTQDGSDLLRARIAGMGYAIAYSSFSDNGYSLKTAIQRTHQLRGVFASTFGQPTRTYLVGHSLGGLAVLALAETHPGQYDDALPMCTPVGGGYVVASAFRRKCHSARVRLCPAGAGRDLPGRLLSSSNR
jgi:pimeloyl-ACP methyl ester carboxylesterase